MSIHFSKIIKAGEKKREFNFTRTSRTGSQYHVNVPDERGNRIFFTMDQEDGQWKILADILPPWIIEAQYELDIAIKEEGQLSIEKDRIR